MGVSGNDLWEFGTGINYSTPEVGEREGNGKGTFPTLGNGKGIKNHSHNLGTGRKEKNTFPNFREWTKAFPKFGNGKTMKKSIPIIWEQESEAFIPRNGQEREFLISRDIQFQCQSHYDANCQVNVYRPRESTQENGRESTIIITLQIRRVQ